MVILVIGDGQMKKNEANNEAKKIFEEWKKNRDEIEEEAKNRGIWQNVGLDSNNHLFKELNRITKGKLEKLKSMIDEE